MPQGQLETFHLVFPFMISFIILFVLGRIVSLVIYRMCWSNGITGNFSRAGALFTLLRRPLPWLLHGAFIWPMLGLSWEDFPLLHGMSAMLAGLLVLGAIGRFGSADLGRFFFADRLLVLVMMAGVVVSPAFLYPCLITCCCLQYTVSSWRLGPGYSNLLGYEFVRASLSVVGACLAVFGWLKLSGIAWHDFESMTLAVLLGFQASTYANNALAKSALGPKWNSWIRENRPQCLVANAWLRGWTFGRSEGCVMKQIRWIGKHRVGICALVWFLEIAWLFLLADSRFAIALIGVTILFHMTVFALTGLAAYQYVVNHFFLLGLFVCHDMNAVFQSRNLIGCLLVIPATALWIGWLHRRILANFQQTASSGRAGSFADAADHLMAWWDTPLMRMYSYTVETRAGACYSLPVPKLSPHDTALTDIHTHLMILGLHGGLDPMIAQDRAIARTGVWGLTVHREDRDFLYHLMDDPDAEKPCTSQSSNAWPPGELPAAAIPLRDLFLGINLHLGKKWFRKILRWPHFPGEDLAPDICPLVEPAMETFRFDEPIASVTLWRIKTFHHDTELRLIERKVVVRIDLSLAMTPDHHQNIREQYASESGAAFYRSVMGDGDPVIHYGIYHSTATPMREATENATRRLLEIALRRLGEVMPAEIIDLGSGPGGPAHLLARETGATVTCVDLCEAHHLENETLARSHGLEDRILTWTGSFEQLPAEWSGCFDLAWSQEALCHAQDITTALREARRVLRPGGILVFSDILLAENAPAEEAEAFSKVNAVTRLRTASEHLRHLEEAGYEEIEHHDWTPHLTENFRRMRERISRDREALLNAGVSAGLLDRFARSLDQRIAWQPGSVLAWGVFACRSGGEC